MKFCYNTLRICQLEKKQLDTKLECLEKHKLKLQNQLLSMRTFQLQYAFNLVGDFLNKLTSTQCFRVFVPFTMDNTNLILLEKKKEFLLDSVLDVHRLGILLPTTFNLTQAKIL